MRMRILTSLLQFAYVTGTYSAERIRWVFDDNSGIILLISLQKTYGMAHFTPQDLKYWGKN